MHCIDKNELEKLIQGKLDPQKMLAVDEHVSACKECKSALQNLAMRNRISAGLGEELMGVTECPEYEELSAFVDNTLGPRRIKAIQAHVNICEPCHCDVERVMELRAQAELRGKVAVQPGASKASDRTPVFYITRIFAGLSTAAVVVALAISLNQPSAKPGGNTVAENPKVKPGNSQTQGKGTKVDKQPGIINPKNMQVNGGVITDKPEINPNVNPKPTPEASKPMLKDGSYRIINSNGQIQVATADGKPVGSLASVLEARIAEKIRTGRVKLDKSMQVAQANTRVRGESSKALPTAPKPASPNGTILINDRPSFRWSAVDGAESYNLRVYDSEGNQVANVITDKTSITINEIGRGDSYTWRVGARFSSADSWSISNAVGFRVVSKESFDTIQNARRTGSHLALGVAYESAGLYSEARREYRALLKQNPGSQQAKRLLNETSGAAK